MRNKPYSIRSAKNGGIALFILITSVAVMALLMRELIQASNSQSIRVKNISDRIQAYYMAKSALNLSRFFIGLDRFIDSQGGEGKGVDTLNDVWTQPVPFPVPVASKESEDKKKAEKEKSSNIDLSSSEVALTDDPLKKCENFFDDFEGNAVGETVDLNRYLDLNSLDVQGINLTYDTLVQLLSPNVEFMQMMNAKGLNPEILARQIRDYMDKDEIEIETRGAETSPYNAAQLEYGPKNRVFMTADELKMIPGIDDEIYEYLTANASAIFIARSEPTAKINLNTVTENVFQALLKDVSNPEDVAEKFIKDRKENKRIYTDATLKADLEKNTGLDSDKIRIALLSGTSDAFLITTTSTVNNVSIQLKSVVFRKKGSKQMEPIVYTRISP